MAARIVVAALPGGGAGIQALRPARARLIAALGSAAALAATIAVDVDEAGRLVLLAEAGGAAAGALLAAALVLRWPRLVPWAVLSVGATYLADREGKAAVDSRAAVVGALLLLAAELAFWSIEHDARIVSERGLVARRALTVVALVGAAAAANVVLLGAAGASTRSGVALAAVGVAAAVAALALVLRLARRTAAS